jgi:tetratricopeptide (TPR) repeat protein
MARRALPFVAGGLAVALVGWSGGAASGSQATESVVLDQAQHEFYSGRYEAAARLAATAATEAGRLPALEIRTAAIHFQLKRLIGDADNKSRAFRDCETCDGLLKAFLADFEAGRALARSRLAASPDDEAATFFLGKINLNYVWLQLATMGRRTGWGEYREARRSIDAVLKKNPTHIRATVAKAWIEYIVDTRVPFLLQWTLGGGSRKKALEMMLKATDAGGERYAAAEARFGLWEMLAREKRFADAAEIARQLAGQFPDNQELRRFIAEHGK